MGKHFFSGIRQNVNTIVKKNIKKDFSVIFATFSPWENNRRSPTNGMVEPMVAFFAPRTKKFVLIDQPHPGSDRLIPTIEIYENGKHKKTTKSSLIVSWLYPLLVLNNTLKTSVAFKIRDFLSVLDFTLRNHYNYDLFIGLESINTLAGVLLKKIGLVKKVVYYVSDFSLQRYRSPFLNKIYLFLDRMAFNHADFVWDVSRAMMSARRTAGLSTKITKVPIYVPIALFSSQVGSRKPIKTIPASLVYAGALGRENGPDLAIYALKKVLRTIPQAQLHIFTNGQDMKTQNLRDLTDRLGIHNKVLFHGLISNQTELIKDLGQFMVGLAPYRALTNSARWWADATRIRLYLAAGLPVITTQVPPVGKELEQEQSGLVVKDNAEKIAQAIISLLKNRNLYRKMRQNAIAQARDNTWDKVYSKTLKDMGIVLT